MAFTIQHHEVENYYRLTQTGSDTQQEHERVKNEVLTMASHLLKIRVLLDLSRSDKINMSKHEQFEHTKNLSDGSLTDMRVAMVLPEKVEYQNDWYFIISMTSTAGVDVKPFYTEAEALRWLLAP